MLVYFAEYLDVQNTLHRLEINNDNFIGESTEINANVILEYLEIEEPLEAIRGTALRIELEATNDLNFIDLYSEDERAFSVSYFRNSINLFNGFLLSEGLFQDFVNDRWIISLDCTGGLGLLKDLAYVQESGLFFDGKQSEMEIVVNCLRRTGILQNINTSINIRYTGLGLDQNPLTNVYLNAERFIKNDNETIEDCENVLRSVLEKYGACITQQNGEWYIFKLNELALNSSPLFFRYDSNGVPLLPSTVQNDLSQNIGSQINGSNIHHVNGNQGIIISPSISAFRVNYKYGALQTLISNNLLQHDDTIVFEWTIIDGDELDLQPNGFGVQITRNVPNNPVLESTSFVISANNTISFSSQIMFSQGSVHTAQFYVILNDGIDDYYLTNQGEWTTVQSSVSFTNKIPNPLAGEFLQPNFVAGIGTIIGTLKSSLTPVSGDIIVQILEPSGDEGGGGIVVGSTFIDSVNIANDIGLIEGELHTVQRSSRPSSKIKENIEIFVGDNTNDIFIGTIYQADQITPTSTWSREDFAEEKPILQIMGEETLRISQSPAQIFSGDIYGYIPYLSTISINTIVGAFVPISYLYNTKENIISLRLRQIFGNELSDIVYELTFDYGNVVEPTII